MKSYEIVIFLLLFDSILVSLYEKNLNYLVIGFVLSVLIYFSIKIISEKFAV
ncbi:hypothetical protein WIW90_10360 [Sulfolobaceae archaeon RB850M]|jgi:ERCC4-type nuclease